MLLYSDACNKLGVVVNHVISTMDTINSKGIKLQVLGQVATVSIDQTDGYALFLADSAKHVQIFSAKSSEMNVNVLVGQDYVETPLAEQFKSEYVNGAWVTNAVEHNE